MDSSQSCEHVWIDTEVGCEDCGTHPAVECGRCGDILDLIFRDDPRDDLK